MNTAATGAAEGGFKKMNKIAINQWQLFKNQLNVTLQKTGQAVLPVLTGSLKEVNRHLGVKGFLGTVMGMLDPLKAYEQLLKIETAATIKAFEAQKNLNKSIKDSPLSVENQTRTNLVLEERNQKDAWNFELIQKQAKEHTKMIYKLKEREFLTNKFTSQTQAQIIMANSLARNSFQIANAFGQAVLHARSLGDALKTVLQQLANRALAGLIAGGIASLIPGGSFINVFRNISGFQHGGRVEQDRPIIVGERRPEVFIPDRPGTIQPEVGGNTLNITVQGAFVGNIDEFAEEIAKRSGQHFNRIAVNA
jgi:hypothetical protein